MKKVLLILGVWAGCLTLVWAWKDIPYSSGVFATITRVTTSETRSDEFLPADDGGWDYGDTEPAITEKYGARPFEYGRVVQIEILLSSPPAGDTWESVMLQSYAGTNTLSSTNWTTMATRTGGLDEIEGVKGCHLGLIHTFPEGTNFLVRIYAKTAAGLATGNLAAQNITAKGDGLTWDNCEVVGYTLTGGRRPSY